MPTDHGERKRKARTEKSLIDQIAESSAGIKDVSSADRAYLKSVWNADEKSVGVRRVPEILTFSVDEIDMGDLRSKRRAGMETSPEGVTAAHLAGEAEEGEIDFDFDAVGDDLTERSEPDTAEVPETPDAEATAEPDSESAVQYTSGPAEAPGEEGAPKEAEPEPAPETVRRDDLQRYKGPSVVVEGIRLTVEDKLLLLEERLRRGEIDAEAAARLREYLEGMPR